MLNVMPDCNHFDGYELQPEELSGPVPSCIPFPGCSISIHSVERLANILFEFYQCTGPISLLELTRYLYQAHKDWDIKHQHSHTAVALTHMGDVMFAQFELSHNLDALEGAIRFYEAAIEQNSAQLGHTIDAEIGLAYALFNRFKTLSTFDDCRTAVEMLEDVRTRINSSDSLRRARATFYTVLIKVSGSSRRVIPLIPDEMQAMALALKSISRDQLSRSECILSLVAEAQLYHAISHRMSQPENLANGLKAGNFALSMCSQEALVLRYRTIVELFELHFMTQQTQTGLDEDHLDAAIALAQQMVESALSTLNPLIGSFSLSCSARAAMYRARRRDDLDAIEQATHIYKKALKLCPKDHIYALLFANHLAFALGVYFEHSGSVSALDDLISLKDINPRFILQAEFFAGNIAEAMISRAEIADLVMAKGLISEAISICRIRENAPQFADDETERMAIDLQMIKASRLQNLTGAQSFLDFETTLHLARRGLEVEVEPYERIGFVLAQVDAFGSQARLMNDDIMLSQAEDLLRIELSSEVMASSIYSVDLIAAQADIMVVRAELAAALPDSPLLQNAWALYAHAARATSGRVRERFQASLRWASNAIKADCKEEALRAYTCAIDILPRVVLYGEDVIGRVEALRQVNGLATSSVSTALALGRLATAINFLEQTRGILWLQSYQTRVPLDLLPSPLAKRFACIIDEIQENKRMDWPARLHGKAEELDSLISDTRKLPGFERFLLPPTLQQLDTALRSREGYSAVLVPSDTGCHVLLLGVSDSRRHLLIPGFSASHVKILVQQLSTDSLTDDRQRDANQARKVMFAMRGLPGTWITQVLSDLWISLIYPIIKFLGLQPRGSTQGPRRRIWWCPLGTLGSLPLHAAGIYDGPDQNCLAEYVVSSYVPTLAVLHRMLTKDDVESSRGTKVNISLPRILLVAQPEYTDLPPLPSAAEEADCVRKLVPPGSIIDVSDAITGIASVKSVLTNVLEAHILHLACHGHQHQQNPLKSGFDLNDGRLTLEQLMGVRMPHAEFAYLSACESACMDESRPDEGLNLVGAMVHVGFKSVIGTLWAMNDTDGPFIAERIYSRIFRDGVLNRNEVPFALDQAVQELRDAGVPALRWATYVHFGI